LCRSGKVGARFLICTSALIQWPQGIPSSSPGCRAQAQGGALTHQLSHGFAIRRASPLASAPESSARRTSFWVIETRRLLPQSSVRAIDGKRRDDQKAVFSLLGEMRCMGGSETTTGAIHLAVAQASVAGSQQERQTVRLRGPIGYETRRWEFATPTSMAVSLGVRLRTSTVDALWEDVSSNGRDLEPSETSHYGPVRKGGRRVWIGRKRSSTKRILVFVPVARGARSQRDPVSGVGPCPSARWCPRGDRQAPEVSIGLAARARSSAREPSKFGQLAAWCLRLQFPKTEGKSTHPRIWLVGSDDSACNG